MFFRIFVSDIKEMSKVTDEPSDELIRYRHEDPERRKEVDFTKLKQEEIAKYASLLDERSAAGDTAAMNARRKFRNWIDLKQDVGGQQEIKKLTEVVTAMKAFIKPSPNQWIFKETSDGKFLAWYADDVIYHKAETNSYGHITPAYVSLHLKAYRRGRRTDMNLTWQEEHAKGRTVAQMLSNKKAFLETEAAVEAYQVTTERYYKLKRLVGVQMSAVGEGTISSNNWRVSGDLRFDQDGVPAKVVLDDKFTFDKEERDDSMMIDRAHWTMGVIKKVRSSYDRSVDEENVDLVELPIHPYLKVYHLSKYVWTIVHEEYLTEYKWDPTLIDKLIINDGDKKLISILMDQSGSKIEDIVKGKMSGVIVLATGAPGIGKTLTAEVFSETVHKPIYNIQCSQLGLDVDTIEKNLDAALNLATRWGAILLIDEADVYIRQRGDDITQNAIVGVFLRRIEYYNGILFMTSNRGESVDDAIISRATAWLKYKLPTTDQQAKIWMVLGKQYGCEFTEAQCAVLTTITDQDISGRTIRNLLKLARMLKGDGEVTIDDIKQVTQYQALT